jgi:hypothetical protein
VRPIKKLTLVFAGMALLGALLVTVGLLDESRRIWFGEYRVEISRDSIQPDGDEGSRGYVIFSPHGRWDSPGRTQESQNELLENGSRIGPAHAIHAEIRTAGGGRYSHWNGFLYFSTSDNSDPRTNGRRYELVVQRRPPPFTLHAGAFLCAVAAFGLGFMPVRRAIGRRLADPGAYRINPRSAGSLALVFLVAAAPSIVWLATLPPSWNYIDSLVVMLYRIAPGVIPHYPLFYPLFTRTVNHWMTHLFEPQAATLAEWGTENLSDTSLYGILVIQHLLFAAAVTYLACVLARTLRRRLLVVLPFYLTPSLSLYNQGIFSEGPWITSLIFVLAAGIHLLRTDRPNAWNYGVYFVAWIAALLTRHVSFIFAFMVPAAMLGLAALEYSRWRQHLTRAALAIAVSVAGWYAVGIVNRVVCPLVGVAYHSVYGRSGVYHITMVDWTAVPAESRESLQRSIQEKSSSPLVAGAVPVIFANRNPWTGTWNDVRTYVAAQGDEVLAGRDVGILTDEILNEVSGLFVRSWNPWYLGRVTQTLRDYWTIYRTNKQADVVFSLGESSLELYARTNQHSFQGVEAVDPAGVARFKAVRESAPYRLANGLHDYHLIWILGGFLVVGVGFRQGKSTYLLAVAALLNLAIYFVLISLVTTSVTRYGLATQIVIPVVLAVVLADFRFPAWITRRPPSSS